MNCKAAETTHNNNAFGPGTANECTVQWWFKKITALKMRSGVASHQLVSVDYDQLRAIIKAGPLTTMWETVEELNFNNSMVLGIWSILERWKILVSGCLMSWLKIKKIIILKCHHLLLYATMKSNFSDCDMWQKVDFIQPPAMTSSELGPRRSSKALPKPNLHQNKVMVTVWWSVAGLIHYSFKNPSETNTSEKYACSAN